MQLAPEGARSDMSDDADKPGYIPYGLEAQEADRLNIPMVARGHSDLMRQMVPIATISTPADIAEKWDLESSTGFHLWSLHLENGMDVLTERIPRLHARVLQPNT